MFGIALYGIFQSSSNKSLDDFFLAGKNISWVTAMFSIVATETSVLTFISIPGIAYRGDWTFLQLSMGYIVGRVLVSFILLPIFFERGITSIYEVLERKFNIYIQRLASATFLVTRVLADGVRFLATAIIIQTITGWSINESIFLIGIITLIYTVSGGLRVIMQIDSFQFLIYLLSAFICIFFLIKHINIDNSILYSLNDLYSSDKIRVFNFSENFLSNPFTFFSAFIGGVMLSFASHGSDYMMVQRVLATKDIISARKAMIGSGVFVMLQFLLFLFVGSLIYIASDCIMIDKDKEIPYVIKNILPIGFKGIVIAGVLSAAMSTLSSSINSLSSSTIRDWFPNIKSIKISRFIALGWTIVLIITALFLNGSDNALVIVGLKIASFTYGVLLSFFILSKIGMFKTESLIIGYVYGILSVLLLSYLNISWTFYIVSSVLINISITLLVEKTSKYKFIRDIVIISGFFLALFLCFSKSVASTDKNLITLSVKEDCKDNKVWTGGELMLLNELKFDNIKNVGLLTNHTSQIIDINFNEKMIINKFNNINIKFIFTPEHGLLNDHGAGEYVSNNSAFNIPVISLYGNNFIPDRKILEDLDAIIFDIQDIGSRYYTYISTMTKMMEVCAQLDIKFYVLDRPNPISGYVNGPILDKDFSSFVGMHRIPIRHGMTIGEIAYMINGENLLTDNIDLYIVKMEGWNRNLYYNDLDLEFIPPSPNIPNLETAVLYSGLCLIEGTNLSEGRGTDFPFKLIGAPWLNVDLLLNNYKLNNYEGINIKKATFKPKSIIGKSISPKYENIICNGIEIEITDMKKARPLDFSINLINEIYLTHKNQFKFNSNNFIDKLYGSDIFRLCIEGGCDIDELIDSWEVINENKYLLY